MLINSPSGAKSSTFLANSIQPEPNEGITGMARTIVGGVHYPAVADGPNRIAPVATA